MAIIRLTEELQSGMKLGQDIYNKDNVLLLARGAVLNEDNIQVIKRLGYTRVSVQKSPDQPGFWYWLDKKKLMDFQKSYEESGEEVVELIKQISDGQQVNIEQAYQIPGSILKETHSPYNLFPYMIHLDQLDHHTSGHSINVSLICSAICQWLELEAGISKDIIVAGLLHDIGKSRLNPDILYKSQLTLKEQEEFKNHTTYGFQILEEANAPEIVRMAALCHHEREDRSGYPNGLAGIQIPFTAKIVAVADVYDTMISEQSRSGKVCPFKVIEILQLDYLGVLDAKILITFLARIAECYVGEMVRLTDGRAGQIVCINRTYPARPMVRTQDNRIINLLKTPRLSIDTILPVGGNQGDSVTAGS
ncbi:MAG: HD domain-containing protein [Peptococcaceae bacterium]|nr:HD domain-containing protein [Peptococcaceae bacterium]